jgi:hypothetical protein
MVREEGSVGEYSDADNSENKNQEIEVEFGSGFS